MKAIILVVLAMVAVSATGLALERRGYRGWTTGGPEGVLESAEQRSAIAPGGQVMYMGSYSIALGPPVQVPVGAYGGLQRSHSLSSEEIDEARIGGGFDFYSSPPGSVERGLGGGFDFYGSPAGSVERHEPWD